EALAAEARTIDRSEYQLWPLDEAFSGEWLVHPLISVDGGWDLAQRANANLLRAPAFARVARELPGVLLAGYSLLAPGTHIFPHADHVTRRTLRCHLGLSVPEGAGLRMNGEVRMHRDGTCLGFESEVQHEAFNLGERDRLVLLVDFDRDALAHGSPLRERLG
ncbi:MAG: aspartyl/asparaginyl beta-hydroxylase domain-containing protein, partial [Planctomycetota bacterium]